MTNEQIQALKTKSVDRIIAEIKAKHSHYDAYAPVMTWGEFCTIATERDADKALIAELTEALKQSVAGYKSCLRMGYDRIIDLGGECDAPEVMIAGNPDIQQAEKVLAAGITLVVGGEDATNSR